MTQVPPELWGFGGADSVRGGACHMFSTLLSGRLAVGQRTSVQGGGEGAVRVPEPHGVQGQQVLALGHRRTLLDTTEEIGRAHV